MNSEQSSHYFQQVISIHQQLGIDEDYANRCGLDLQVECEQLVKTELDVFDRQPLMETKAYDAWQEMKSSALEDNIHLQIVSAYRSAQYQQTLFLNKIAKGQILSDILKVNAAPGYSEHHTGQAVDITCPDFEPLSEDFENSAAFGWLSKNAENFGFYLSFPKNNTFGFLYEPWHWRYFTE